MVSIPRALPTLADPGLPLGIDFDGEALAHACSCFDLFGSFEKTFEVVFGGLPWVLVTCIDRNR